MIPIETLNLVTRIVTHASCADGVASALILRDVLPGREIVFLQHGSHEARTLAATPGTLFCDFVPPCDRIAEFVAAGAIVLDHHRGACDIVEAFGPLGVFADEATEPGVSGAVLAFREVWEPRYQAERQMFRHEGMIRKFAMLAGIRDTWQRNHQDWQDACAQAAELTFFPFEHWETLHHAAVSCPGDVGSTLLTKRDEDVTRALSQADRFTSRKQTSSSASDSPSTRTVQA